MRQRQTALDLKNVRFKRSGALTSTFLGPRRTTSFLNKRRDSDVVELFTPTFTQCQNTCTDLMLLFPQYRFPDRHKGGSFHKHPLAREEELPDMNIQKARNNRERGEQQIETQYEI